MGDWNFLGGILEEVHIHSTRVGKVWLTVLFIFRMLVLGVAAEDVWNDEQVDFMCNTQQPGCRNVCYDCAFPVSLVRYWVLQVILVSSPSLAYMGDAIYRLRALEKRRHCRKAALRRELETLESNAAEERRLAERELRRLEQGRLNKAPLRGSLLRTYCAHVLTRLVVEVGFMLGQHLLYGTRLEPVYRCDRPPCPNTVDCFVSRPTEKSMFMVFMQAMAAVSLFLSLLEILHLGHTKLRRGTAECCACVSDGSGDFSGSSGTRQVCASQGRKATVLSAPTGGYFLLLEKKQANGPSLVPLAGSTPTWRPSGGKKGSETQDEGGDSREDAAQPAPPTSDSTSCPSGAAWTMQRISSRGMGKKLEKTLESFKRPTETQRCDFTAKQNERTMKSWSDSARSPALSPDRRTSLVSTGSSSRRDTDLQI